MQNTEDIKKYDELKWYKTTVQDNLLPCPLCKCEKIILNILPKENIEKLHCWDCGITLQKAIGVGVVKTWNKRVL